MDRNEVPPWVLALEQEHLEFIRKFVLNSGSLKDMAVAYQVSYPTVRTKLNQLIQRIESVQEDDVEFVNMIKNLVIDERISLDVAKVIIDKYRMDKSH
ncbi:DUF2089 family protein [Exiguobacterium sp. s127]|uniref:DUF2089 family protein n=1 Tax=Exiguobacterium sp. s127 TaxID=2751210 RepID=UPI001BE65445|nr:DUF2089 family protein [Exiguobacterium sp. s127]